MIATASERCVRSFRVESEANHLAFTRFFTICDGVSRAFARLASEGAAGAGGVATEVIAAVVLDVSRLDVGLDVREIGTAVHVGRFAGTGTEALAVFDCFATVESFDA